MDNTLIYGLATLGVGVMGLAIRYGFKSKCSDVGLCFGFITIKRDIQGEVQAEKNELELGHSNEEKV